MASHVGNQRGLKSRPRLRGRLSVTLRTHLLGWNTLLSFTGRLCGAFCGPSFSPVCLMPGTTESALKPISLASLMRKVPAGTCGGSHGWERNRCIPPKGAGRRERKLRVPLKGTIFIYSSLGSFDETQDCFSDVWLRGKAEKPGFAEKYIKQPLWWPS